MKKTALFFDIDGTLTNNHTGIIQQSALEAIKIARSNGHLAFINTGRTICSIQPEIKNLDLDGFLCGCGTHLIFHGKSLFHHSIDRQLCQDMIDCMISCRIDAVLEAEEDLYFTSETSRLQDIEYMRNIYTRQGLGLKHPTKELSVIYDKFFAVTDELSDTKPFFEMIHKDMEIIDRERGRYEIVPKGYSKATAIDFIRKEFFIDMDQIYVFGDSSNDLPMFEYAIHTIAMGEHSKALEPYTEFVTKKAEDDGIAFALKKYGLI